MSTNCSSLKGFVKISTSWSLVLTISSVMSPFCAWSLRNWCLISICLVLECCTRFFYMLMVLVLSHLIRTCSKDKPKSLSVYFIQRIFAQHKPTTMYLAPPLTKLSNFVSYYVMKQVSVLRNDMCHWISLFLACTNWTSHVNCFEWVNQSKYSL